MPENIEELSEIPQEVLMHYCDEHVLSTNSISEENKRGIRAAAEFLEENGHKDLAFRLLQKYSAKDIPTYDVENSQFVSWLRREQVGYNTQGYVTVGVGEDAIRYPIINLNGDIMRLESAFLKYTAELLNGQNKE
jgi:DNA-binding LacI/PurR family transcriptional regulator